MKQFHSFRLDIVNHCLWNGEDRVSLTPKAFDVLRYLVEYTERLVTRTNSSVHFGPDISEQTIRSLAGHVSNQMLQHYSHIRSHAKQAAIMSPLL